MCIDVWLTREAGSCPLCCAPFPPPEQQHRHAADAYDKYQAAMANGGREEIMRRQHEESRRVEAEEAQRRQRELEALTSLAAGVPP
eukprot:CAMPEP_0174726366 /NCGR_PEP_ID=MMETSP1094-20130205/47651_1 /TAXON_ID=156173 /ORGANISM="Chrysochromulina brevifilum, Strain UTEX LB 985" /LENGTH=85 /DNA_ID=CAMNT_0015927933 /DNA_START=31 /DNA_END=288 /DNA_ORIENTATION=+